MSYRIGTIAPFRKEAKKLIKKYPSLKTELDQLGKELSEDPTNGTLRNRSAVPSDHYSKSLRLE